ncbi:6424_t:CDS:2, partial [Gigaspora rosea]
WPSLCELAAILNQQLCDKAQYVNYNEHEITQSLYYYAVIESNELPSYEPEEEEYDTQQIHLNSLLADLPSNEIIKIYRIQ